MPSGRMHILMVAYSVEVFKESGSLNVFRGTLKALCEGGHQVGLLLLGKSESSECRGVQQWFRFGIWQVDDPGELKSFSLPLPATELDRKLRVLAPSRLAGEFDIIHFCVLGIERSGKWIESLPQPLLVDCHDSATRHRFRECFHRLKWNRPGLPKAIAKLGYDLYRERMILSRQSGRKIGFALLSEGDRAVFARLAARSIAGVAIPYVDMLEHPSPPRLDESSAIGFYGWLDGAWNDGALRELLYNIWPRVRKIQPQAELRIYGRGGKNIAVAASSIPGVAFVGETKSIQSAMAKCALVCFPYHYGSGIKTKILECLAWGVPVVTSAVGAEGLPQAVRDCLLIGKDNRQMVEFCIQLLSEPKTKLKMADQGRAAVGFFFNRQTACQSYERLYQTLASHADCR